MKTKKNPIKSLSGRNRVRNGVKCLQITLTLIIKLNNRSLMTEFHVHLAEENLIRKQLKDIFLVVLIESKENDTKIVF